MNTPEKHINIFIENGELQDVYVPDELQNYVVYVHQRDVSQDGKFNEYKQTLHAPQAYMKEENGMKFTACHIATTYPFEIYNNDFDNEYMIITSLTIKPLGKKYSMLCDMYRIGTHGNTIKELITEILTEKQHRYLLQNTDFHSNGSYLFISTSSIERQDKLLRILSPVFSDLTELEKIIVKYKSRLVIN